MAPLALPKKRCLELSQPNKRWNLERLKGPDTFFWQWKSVLRKKLVDTRGCRQLPFFSPGRTMLLQPVDQVSDKALRVGLKFQRMVRPGIFDDVQVRRGELLNVAPGGGVVDDAIFFRQQQQDGHGYVRRCGAQVT